MITGFRHKGLKLFWTKGDRSKLPVLMVAKIERVLNIIDYLEKVPEDLQDIIFLRPHPLKRDLKDFWAMDISGNWRVIFKFDNNNSTAYDIDFIDYH